MKTILTMIAVIMLFITATAMSNPNLLVDGVYTSNHGDIHVLNSKSNKKTVGLYRGAGHILLSNFSISGRGTTYTGSFSNGKSTGVVAYTAQSGKAWKGQWRWKNSARNKWDGTWNGNWKTSTANPQLVMWNTFETDLGTMELIHNPEGKVAGFLYHNGKEYYVHGSFGGYPEKFKAYITEDENNLKTSGAYDIDMNWDHGLHGKISIRGRSHTGVRGSVDGKQIKITLQTLKNYKNRGVAHNQEIGKVTIDASLFDEKGRHWTYNLYRDQNAKHYLEKKEYSINRSFTNLVSYSKTGKGYYKNPKLGLNFTHIRQRAVLNTADRLVAHTVPIKEIIDYLTYKRSASSFTNAADGRKKISGSDHEFWLSESNGKRKARGYAFIKYGSNDKWGYFYTIELQ